MEAEIQRAGMNQSTRAKAASCAQHVPMTFYAEVSGQLGEFTSSNFHHVQRSLCLPTQCKPRISQTLTPELEQIADVLSSGPCWLFSFHRSGEYPDQVDQGEI